LKVAQLIKPHVTISVLFK